MLQRYREGKVPVAVAHDDFDDAVSSLARETLRLYVEHAKDNDFSGSLDYLWTHLRHLDGYIVNAQPWNLAKAEAADPKIKDKLDTVLCYLWRSLRMTSVLIAPVMPDLAQHLWENLGFDGLVADQRINQLIWDTSASGPVADPKPLFQRIDKEKEMSELEAANAAPAAAAAPSVDVPPIADTVDAESFFKVDLRVGRILEAERVPKSDKLIKMKVDVGLDQRTILGGLGKAYEPEQLLGKLVVVVANLAPRKLMGVESHGMLLAASDNASKPYLVAPPEGALPGFLVK
jgi:methionyl-tRNA synthetase